MFKIYAINIAAWKATCKSRVDDMLANYADDFVFTPDDIEKCAFYQDSDKQACRLFDIHEEILEDPMIPSSRQLGPAYDTFVEFHESLQMADMYPLDYSADWKGQMNKSEVRDFFYDIINDVFLLLEETIRIEEKNKCITEIFTYDLNGLCEIIKLTERSKYIDFENFEKAFKEKEEVEE